MVERGSYGCLEDADARALGDAVELTAKLGITVADDELGTLTKGRELAELPSSPRLAGLARHANVHDLFAVRVDDEEGEQWPEPDVIDLQEVACPDGVVAKERLPRLTIARWAHRHDVSLDGALGDADAELEEFAANTRSAELAFRGLPIRT